MSKEAIYADPEFPDPRVRVEIGQELIGSTIEKAAKAREEYENLPSDAGVIETFIAKGKMQFFNTLENSMKNSNETEARNIEAQHEYLVQHLQDTLRMLNTLEVRKMGMQSKNRRIVED